MGALSTLTPDEDRCVNRLFRVRHKLIQIRLRRFEALANIRLTDKIYNTLNHVNPHRAALLARLSHTRGNAYLLLAHIDKAIRFFGAIETAMLRALGLRRLQ
jgi:hypothetical protein